MKTAEGMLIDTLDDYAVVRELIADLAADGLDSSMSPPIRETVEAIRFLQQGDTREISQAAVTLYLQLDKGAMSQRIRAAIDRGYLKNLENRKGRPARLQLGEPLPADVALPPPPEAHEGDRCTIATEMEGNTTPSLPDHAHVGRNQPEPPPQGGLLGPQDIDNTGCPKEILGLGPNQTGPMECRMRCQHIT